MPSGLFYGLLTGRAPEEAVRLGWAHGALVATFPGDTTMATLDQVRAFANGGRLGYSGRSQPSALSYRLSCQFQRTS